MSVREQVIQRVRRGSSLQPSPSRHFDALRNTRRDDLLYGSTLTSHICKLLLAEGRPLVKTRHSMKLFSWLGRYSTTATRLLTANGDLFQIREPPSTPPPFCSATFYISSEHLR